MTPVERHGCKRLIFLLNLEGPNLDMSHLPDSSSQSTTLHSSRQKKSLHGQSPFRCQLGHTDHLTTLILTIATSSASPELRVTFFQVADHVLRVCRPLKIAPPLVLQAACSKASRSRCCRLALRGRPGTRSSGRFGRDERGAGGREGVSTWCACLPSCALWAFSFLEPAPLKGGEGRQHEQKEEEGNQQPHPQGKRRKAAPLKGRRRNHH